MDIGIWKNLPLETWYENALLAILPGIALQRYIINYFVLIILLCFFFYFNAHFWTGFGINYLVVLPFFLFSLCSASS